jgi:hypothetical protein
MRRLLATVLLALLLAPASAEWKPEYANSPPEVQDWYRNAELTPAARLRFPFTKCCDHADVVKTQFRVSKGKGAHDEWWYLDGDTWKQVPEDIIHWGESAPGGEPTLFIYHDKETCFFPGGVNNL